MTRYSHVASIALASLLPIACNNASDDQAKASNAQREANGEIKSIDRRAARDDLAAQAEADKTIASANADFAKLRNDYGTKTTRSLGDLDRKVDVLETKSTAGKTKAQLEVDERLTRIREKRAQFDADLKTSRSAPEQSWDSQKSHLDQELAELPALVNDSTPPDTRARNN